LILTVLGGAGLATAVPDKYKIAFKDFREQFGRKYESAEEERSRFAIFKANYQFIEAENAKAGPYKLAVNDFADQSADEVRSTRLGLSPPSAGKLWKGAPFLGTDLYSGVQLPAAVDWTDKGAVTPPKNQAQCGSCWAFSTTGALEGAWQIATGKLVSFSEQQLVDCSTDNSGCRGGSMDLAFTYLEDQVVCTEDSYPYSAQAGTCKVSNCTVGIPKSGVMGYKDVPADDEQALMEAVAQQPVSVAIEADQMAFQLYSSGILTKECGAKVDHGVLVVGYGTANGVDYWKVKNSWGPTWGERGYIRIERGVPKAGECGINSGPTYPVVKAVPDSVFLVV